MEAFLRTALEQQRAGASFFYVVEERESGRALGMISFDVGAPHWTVFKLSHADRSIEGSTL